MSLKFYSFHLSLKFRKVLSTSTIEVLVSIMMLRSQFKSKIIVIFALVAPATVVARLLIFVMLQFTDVIVFLFEKG